MGNNEFKTAKYESMKFLQKLGLEEVDIFMKDFLPSYLLSLDEQHISL